MKIEDIKIDEEFKNLLPGLSDDELKQLRDNIISDGEIREPFIVWDGLLVDGHNRRDVWVNLTDEERKKVAKPSFILKKFNSREEAMDWMIAKQLGQRNLSQQQRDYLIGRRYRSEKKDVSKNLKSSKNAEKLPKGQNVQQAETAEKIGTEVGKSGKQVRRDADYSEAIDAIEKELGKEAKKEILSGTKKVPKAKVIEIGELEPEKMQAAFDRAMGRGTPSGGNTFEPDEWGGTEESKGIKDGLGHVIPDDIAQHFTDAEGLKEVLGYIAKAKKKLKELSGLECFYQVNFQAVESCLKNTVSELKPYRPHTECPKCRRKVSQNCDLCKGTGIITFAQYGSGKGGGVLTNEEREWLDNRG